MVPLHIVQLRVMRTLVVTPVQGTLAAIVGLLVAVASLPGQANSANKFVTEASTLVLLSD